MNDWTLLNAKAQDVLPGEYAGQVALIVTSPPYDSMRSYNGYAAAFDFDAIAAALVECLMPGGVMVWVTADQIVDGGETLTSLRQAIAIQELGLRCHQTLIYEHAAPRVISPNRAHHTISYMWVFSKGKPAVANIPKDRPNMTAGRYKEFTRSTGRTGDTKAQRNNKPLAMGSHGRRTDIWRYANGFQLTAARYESHSLIHEHPAVFPYALATDHISAWTNPGDLVLDPMAGSGTTIRAAVDLDRRALGVEVNPDYCDLIRRRMAQGVLI